MSEFVVECWYDFDDGWIPVEHREEIVRCKDCKHSYEVTWPAGSNIPHDYLDCCGELVENWDYYNDEPKLNPVKPDGFCAWALRKEMGE